MEGFGAYRRVASIHWASLRAALCLVKILIGRGVLKAGGKLHPIIFGDCSVPSRQVQRDWIFHLGYSRALFVRLQTLALRT